MAVRKYLFQLHLSRPIQTFCSDRSFIANQNSGQGDYLRRQYIATQHKHLCKQHVLCQQANFNSSRQYYSRGKFNSTSQYSSNKKCICSGNDEKRQNCIFIKNYKDNASSEKTTHTKYNNYEKNKSSLTSRKRSNSRDRCSCKFRKQYSYSETFNSCKKSNPGENCNSSEKCNSRQNCILNEKCYSIQIENINHGCLYSCDDQKIHIYGSKNGFSANRLFSENKKSTEIIPNRLFSECKKSNKIFSNGLFSECKKSYEVYGGQYNRGGGGSFSCSMFARFLCQQKTTNKAAEETKKKMPGRAAETISLIHYNDVYNVEARDVEPVGGAARFVSAIKSYNQVEPLILFSGDIFAPSIMSTFTKGEQMVPVLNATGTQCAVFGNHDFDFGLDVLTSLIEKTEFPWLMSNVIDNEAAQPLGNGKVSQIIEWKGRKLGLIGLVEREWLETLATINPDEVTYTDYVDAGSMLASELKHKGCEYVIALTHMRTPNDIRLAENVPEIDLILGGHDHVYEKRKVNGTYILKSGTDFRQFSVVTLDFRETPVEVDIEAVNVTKEFEPDEELNNVLEKYSDVVEGKMGEVLGEISCDLDGRFSSVRTAETNLGNLVTDIMVAALACDCALVNSGTLRSDTIHPKGQFLLRDLLSILPMMDALVVLDVTGEQIHGALENGVSQWPKLEGRFPQVSGIRFAFDPSQPPGHRVDPQFVKIGDEYLELNNHYKLITKSYLANGKDGYDCLAAAPVLVDDECAPTLTSAVQNHFKAISMVKNTKDRKTSVHHQSLVTLSRKTSIVRQLTEDGHLPASHLSVPPSPRSHSPVSEVGRAKSPGRGRLCHQPSVEDLEKAACQLTPGVEGRILQLTPEVAKQLKQEKDMDISRLVIAEVDEQSNPNSPEDDVRRELFGTAGKSSANNTGEQTKPQNGTNGTNGTAKEDVDLK